MSQTIGNILLETKTYCHHIEPCFSASFKYMNICDNFLLLISMLLQDGYVLLPEDRKLWERGQCNTCRLIFSSIREFLNVFFRIPYETKVLKLDVNKGTQHLFQKKVMSRVWQMPLYRTCAHLTCRDSATCMKVFLLTYSNQWAINPAPALDTFGKANLHAEFWI